MYDNNLNELLSESSTMSDDTIKYDTDAIEARRNALVNSFTYKCERVSANPNIDVDDFTSDATHWKVTLKRNGKRMTVYYSQGSAYTAPPTLENVLCTMAMDVDWADLELSEYIDDLGYPYHKARRIRKAVRHNTTRLAKLVDLNELQQAFEGW